jgi:hypothetical protein
MNFFASLLVILKSLPALVKLVTELAEWMKATFGDDPSKFIADASESFQKVQNAKTPEEKRAAARDIALLIRRL